MLDAKMLADLITLMRAAMAVSIVWLGFVYGIESLPLVICMMILCWMGDFVDGRIARLSQPLRHSWVGDHDLQIDLFVSLCLGAYLVACGYVSWLLAFCYLAVWTLLIWRYGPDYNLQMLVQAPTYAAFIVIALRDEFQYGRWILAGIFAALVINWQRFTIKTVPGFIAGMKSLFGGHGAVPHP